MAILRICVAPLCNEVWNFEIGGIERMVDLTLKIHPSRFMLFLYNINLIFMNNFRSRRDGRNARRCAHFHIVQRQHESWWMDFLSQINHAFNSSDFKIPYFIAQWSHKNSWNRQSSFPLWFYDFFLRQFGISCISMKVVNQLPINKMLINILQRRCLLF